MPKYIVSIPMFATVFATVEAESEESAIIKAESSYHASLCNQCSNDIELGEHDDSGESVAYIVA